MLAVAPWRSYFFGATVTLLEALLRVSEFQAFETLLLRVGDHRPAHVSQRRGPDPIGQRPGPGRAK